MKCDDARLLLWPDPDAPLDASEAREALAHYRQCAACRQFFGVQRALGARLRRLGRPVRAPDGLREGTLARLHTDTARRRRRTRWMAGSGTALLAAAATLFVLLREPPMPQPVAGPLVEELRAAAPAGDALVSSEITDVERWLAERVGYAVVVPEIAGARLEGGRVARLDGRPVAVAIYAMHGMPLSYFALPSRDIMGRTVRADQPMGASADGYEVAVWTERGQARAIVAQMRRDDVMAIAEECREKALMRLQT